MTSVNAEIAAGVAAAPADVEVAAGAASANTLDANVSRDFFLICPDEYTVDVFTERAKKLQPTFRKLHDTKAEYDAQVGGPSVERDLLVAKDFLYSNGLPFECVRFLAEVPVHKQAGFDQVSGVDYRLYAMLTYFTEIKMVRLSFHFTAKNVTLNELIYLRQSSGYMKLTDADGHEFSCVDLREQISSILGTDQCFDESVLIEVTRMYDCETVDQIEQEHLAEMYGIVSGDEGWRFVPESVVRARLSLSWGSRSFMRFYPVNGEFLFINLIGSQQWTDYVEHQRSFGTQAYGGPNDYFLLESCPLTVNHGIMNSCEYVMAVRALSDALLEMHTTLESTLDERYVDRIHATKRYRARVLSTLRRIENISISEMGELSALLMNHMGITSNVERVKYLLELLESELMLLYQQRENEYQQRENCLIAILTVVGLLLAFIDGFWDLLPFQFLRSVLYG